MKTSKTKKVMGVFLLVCFVFVGFSTYAAAGDFQPMTITTGADPNFAIFYVAKAGGVFKKFGLDVDLKMGASGSATIPYLISGDSQCSFGSEGKGILVHNIAPDKIALLMEGSNLLKFHGIVSSSKIKTVKELLGKKVAVAKGTGSEAFFMDFLAHYGFNLGQFEIINIEAPEMIPALERGDIDAYSAVAEPWLTRGVWALKEKAHILRDSEGIHNPSSMMYISKVFAKKYPATYTRFTEALVYTADWINRDIDETSLIAAETLQLDPKLCRELMTKVVYRSHIDKTTIKNIKIAHKQQFKLGNVDKELPDREWWDSFIMDAFIKSVKPENVNYHRYLPAYK